MPSPYLAPSLARLRTAIDIRWPGRDRSSDGWIGDRAHQARTSDHNPDPRTGVVRAIDLDKDGLHVPSVLAALILHPSVRYVIHARRIMHVDSQFRPKVYTGSNDHAGHIHGSIQHTKTAENAKNLWPPVDGSFKWPLLEEGSGGTHVRQLQAYLIGHGFSLAVDGGFGPATRSAVIAFQRRFTPSDVDGVVGPSTHTALRTR